MCEQLSVSYICDNDPNCSMKDQCERGKRFWNLVRTYQANTGTMPSPEAINAVIAKVK